MVTCGGDQCAWLRASLMEDLVRVRRAMCSTHSYPTLNHWRARSGVDPPRPIPNRVVKHSSAEGTARLPCGRLGLCAIHENHPLIRKNQGVVCCVRWGVNQRARSLYPAKRGTRLLITPILKMALLSGAYCNKPRSSSLLRHRMPTHPSAVMAC